MPAAEPALPANVAKAAIWYATSPRDPSRAAVPLLGERFGLTAAEACAALREANLIRARAT